MDLGGGEGTSGEGLGLVGARGGLGFGLGGGGEREGGEGEGNTGGGDFLESGEGGGEGLGGPGGRREVYDTTTMLGTTLVSCTNPKLPFSPFARFRKKSGKLQVSAKMFHASLGWKLLQAIVTSLTP